MNDIVTSGLADPVAKFRDWFDEAKQAEPYNTNAMSLATANAAGTPSVRMVLVISYDERGFVFYTNAESRKGGELAENPQAALCAYWKSLKRSVRIEGPVAVIAAEEADAYFASRPRGSQIGAWASDQSRPMEGRFHLEQRIAQFTAKFGIGKVSRPDHWRGYRIVPARIEFWAERPFRLHDRTVFLRDGGGWKTERLFP
jgi:pyridoxamine 5'-phosphate oxidase